MNKKFKIGDKVRVRNYTDEKWESAVFIRYDSESAFHHVVSIEKKNSFPKTLNYMFCEKVKSDEGAEFERDDKVQVRNSHLDEWVPAKYIAYVPECDTFSHLVLCDAGNGSFPFVGAYQYCQTDPTEEVKFADIESLKQEVNNLKAVMNGAITHLNGKIKSLENQLK